SRTRYSDRTSCADLRWLGASEALRRVLDYTLDDLRSVSVLTCGTHCRLPSWVMDTAHPPLHACARIAVSIRTLPRPLVPATEVGSPPRSCEAIATYVRQRALRPPI